MKTIDLRPDSTRWGLDYLEGTGEGQHFVVVPHPDGTATLYFEDADGIDRGENGREFEVTTTDISGDGFAEAAGWMAREDPT